MFRRLYEFFTITKTVKDVVQDFKRKDLQLMRDIMTSDLKISGIRSSRPELFCKKGVLGNFAKLTEKHLCQSLFFNKVTGLTPEVEISKDTYSCRTPLVAASPCCSDIVILRIVNNAHVCLSFLIMCKELNF